MRLADPKTALWVLSQPRVGSMFLIDILNRIKPSGENSFQEYFFFEVSAMRALSVRNNSSSIRLYEEMLHFRDLYPEMRKSFQPVVATMLHGSDEDIRTLRGSEAFKVFRSRIDSHMIEHSLPPLAKIHRRHFNLFFDDKSAVNMVDKGEMPSRFIVIDRSDKIAQAVSIYITAKSGKIVRTRDDEARNLASISCDESQLRAIYSGLLSGIRSTWGGFLNSLQARTDVRVSVIDFDALMVNPAQEIAVALEAVGEDVCPITLNNVVHDSTLRSTSRPESAELISRLRASIELKPI